MDQDHYLSGSGYDCTTISNAPFADGRLTRHALVVYVVIAMHAQASSGNSAASVRQIAREARCGTETAQFALRDLLALGYVEKMVGGPRKASTYKVHATPTTPIPYDELIDSVPIEERGPIADERFVATGS